MRDNALYIAIFITIAIAFLSFVKIQKESMPAMWMSDKISHVIAYFFLMFFWLYSFVKKKHFQILVKYLISGCFIYGMIIEYFQSVITSYRTTSYLDLLANSVGIALGVLAFHIFEKKIRLI